MAYVDGYGLCSVSCEALGQGTLLIGGGGVSECPSEALAKPSFIFGGAGLADCQLVALAKLSCLVKVSSITPSHEVLRVLFDRPMKLDDELLASYNYTTVVNTPGAAPIVVNTVTPEEEASNPEYVDLGVSEMTIGASYTCSVSTTDGPVDVDDTPIDPANNSDTFAGVGEYPEVLQLISQSSNRIDVVFTEAMKDNADIRNASKYAFDNGLLVLNVLDVDGDTVKLVTSDQSPGIAYTLTLTP